MCAPNHTHTYMYCIGAIVEIYNWIILDLPYYPILATLTSASSPVPTLLRHFGRRHKKKDNNPHGSQAPLRRRWSKGLRSEPLIRKCRVKDLESVMSGTGA